MKSRFHLSRNGSLSCNNHFPSLIAHYDHQQTYFCLRHSKGNEMRSPLPQTDLSKCTTDGSTVQRAVPTAVADYNQHKSGVDTIDQFHSYYSIGRKSKKWRPRLIWWLIDMCIINAYSLYQQKQQVLISQLQFRQQLIQQLMEQYQHQDSSMDMPLSTSHQQTRRGHWPSRANVERDCVYCSIQPKQRTCTSFQCEQCRVHLCIDPCFKLFHTHN